MTIGLRSRLDETPVAGQRVLIEGQPRHAAADVRAAPDSGLARSWGVRVVEPEPLRHWRARMLTVPPVRKELGHYLPVLHGWLAEALA